MFGGTGSALMLMIAIDSYPGTPPLETGLIALAFIGLGLLLVWIELGRPWRFLHVYFHPQTSWMTREASVAILLFPIALIGIVFKIPVMITMAGVLGLVFLYCQGRILLASKGIPSWREPVVLPLIISSGLAEGAALLLLSSLIIDSAPGWMLYLLLVLLAIRIQSWNRYRRQLAVSKAPEKTLQVLSGIHATTFLGGNVLPFILVSVSLVMPDLMVLLVSVASILTVMSGWHMKFTIVVHAAQQQGYSLGKLRRGRPVITPPVRRKPDKFVFK